MCNGPSFFMSLPTLSLPPPLGPLTVSVLFISDTVSSAPSVATFGVLYLFNNFVSFRLLTLFLLLLCVLHSSIVEFIASLFLAPLTLLIFMSADSSFRKRKIKFFQNFAYFVRFIVSVVYVELCKIRVVRLLARVFIPRGLGQIGLTRRIVEVDQLFVKLLCLKSVRYFIYYIFINLNNSR